MSTQNKKTFSIILISLAIFTIVNLESTLLKVIVTTISLYGLLSFIQEEFNVFKSEIDYVLVQWFLLLPIVSIATLKAFFEVKISLEFLSQYPRIQAFLSNKWIYIGIDKAIEFTEIFGAVYGIYSRKKLDLFKSNEQIEKSVIISRFNASRNGVENTLDFLNEKAIFTFKDIKETFYFEIDVIKAKISSDSGASRLTL